jgi:hypothetical protein
MRSRYLKWIIELALTVCTYAMLVPVLIFLKEFLGIDNQAVFKLVDIVVFVIVYGIIAIVVEFVFGRLNDRLRAARKQAGGRDIAAEEAHEDDATGLISLSIKDEK